MTWLLPRDVEEAKRDPFPLIALYCRACGHRWFASESLADEPCPYNGCPVASVDKEDV